MHFVFNLLIVINLLTAALVASIGEYFLSGLSIGCALLFIKVKGEL